MFVLRNPWWRWIVVHNTELLLLLTNTYTKWVKPSWKTDNVLNISQRKRWCYINYCTIIRPDNVLSENAMPILGSKYTNIFVRQPKRTHQHFTYERVPLFVIGTTLYICSPFWVGFFITFNKTKNYHVYRFMQTCAFWLTNHWSISICYRKVWYYVNIEIYYCPWH